ncbi:MAG: hypothetical protein QJR13_07885 [Bacillota bacterium]|nr:hypothetical protein [Bacillota bacterium]
MILFWTVLAATAVMVGWGGLRLIVPMLQEGGLLRPNYRGCQVPVGAGLILALAPGMALGPVLWWSIWAGRGAGAGEERFALLLALTGSALGFLGFVDDALGSHAARGWRGHWRALWREGRLTTGGLKAIGGGAAALLSAAALQPSPGATPWMVVPDALLIALGANLVNLLDLRPGRALKGFLLLLLLLWASAGWSDGGVVWRSLPVALLALLCLPGDLKGRFMLGDTGANALGAAWGLLAARHLTLPLKVAAVAALAALHWYAERHSLTEVIQRVPWLRSLDQWGRGEEVEEKD